MYHNDKETVVMLVNGTLENFETTEFLIKGIEFNQIISVDKDGQERLAKFELEGDILRINRALPYMSTATFIMIF